MDAVATIDRLLANRQQSPKMTIDKILAVMSKQAPILLGLEDAHFKCFGMPLT